MTLTQTANSRYYSPLSMVFVTLLLTANILSEKPLLFGSMVVPAGLLLFPITYLLGGVLAEVYGFSKSRYVIWVGMGCNVFMALMCRIILYFPAVETWEHHLAYAQVLERLSRLMFISVFSYCTGELVNAYIVSKLREYMKGKLFWVRALCGSWIGEGLETLLFVPLAFYQTMSSNALCKLVIFYYVFKFLYVLCAMPLINVLVAILKKQEGREEKHYETSNRATIALN